MADIKLKDINALETWNQKELRKLKMTTNNRISAFKISDNPKALPQNHPLFEKDIAFCQQLVEAIVRAEKVLSRSQTHTPCAGTRFLGTRTMSLPRYFSQDQQLINISTQFFHPNCES